MKTIFRICRDTGGASAAEYALILAYGLGQVIAGSMNDTGTCISTSGATCPA